MMDCIDMDFMALGKHTYNEHCDFLEARFQLSLKTDDIKTIIFSSQSCFNLLKAIFQRTFFDTNNSIVRVINTKLLNGLIPTDANLQFLGINKQDIIKDYKFIIKDIDNEPIYVELIKENSEVFRIKIFNQF